MMEVGTLKELGVDVGDVVQVVGLAVLGTSIENGREWTIKSIDGDIFLGVKPEYIKEHKGILLSGTWHLWRIITRAKDKPKLWRDMTPEEKGALLLAVHEGKKTQVFTSWGGWVDWPDCGAYNGYAYRIKPQPKVETITFNGHIEDGLLFRGRNEVKPQVSITFQTIDGKPDCASIKMEAL